MANEESRQGVGSEGAVHLFSSGKEQRGGNLLQPPKVPGEVLSDYYQGIENKERQAALAIVADYIAALKAADHSQIKVAPPQETFSSSTAPQFPDVGPDGTPNDMRDILTYHGILPAKDNKPYTSSNKSRAPNKVKERAAAFGIVASVILAACGGAKDAQQTPAPAGEVAPQEVPVFQKGQLGIEVLSGTLGNIPPDLKPSDEKNNFQNIVSNLKDYSHDLTITDTTKIPFTYFNFRKAGVALEVGMEQIGTFKSENDPENVKPLLIGAVVDDKGNIQNTPMTWEMFEKNGINIARLVAIDSKTYQSKEDQVFISLSQPAKGGDINVLVADLYEKMALTFVIQQEKPNKDLFEAILGDPQVAYAKSMGEAQTLIPQATETPTNATVMPPSATATQEFSKMVAVTPTAVLTYVPPTAESTITVTPTAKVEAPVVTATESVENLPITSLIVDSFNKAMKDAGMPISTTVKDLEIKTKTASDGTKYNVASTKDGKYDLMVKTENGWVRANPRFFADKLGLILEAPSDPGAVGIETIANQLLLTGELDASTVFKNFNDSDWKNVLNNWDQIKKDLDSKKVPDSFPYNWGSADQKLSFAKSRNMTTRAQHLMWGGDVPDSIYNGNYSEEEIAKILEFTVKVRVLEYNGTGEKGLIVDQWDVGDELGATITYPHDKWDFWIKKLGGANNALKSVSNWVKEANPNAKQVIAEDGMLHLGADRANWKQNFFSVLSYASKNKLPIDIVDIENNFWIGNPPSKEEQIAVLKSIIALGFNVTAETTVATSNNSPVWFDTVKKANVTNVLEAQSNIYINNIAAYLAVGSKQFGLGGTSNNGEWYDRAGHPEANAMIIDDSGNPTLAYWDLVKFLSNQNSN